MVSRMQKFGSSQFSLDGEDIICDDNGLAIFDKLHSKVKDASVTLCAFDVLELDGEDCRRARLDDR